MIVLLGAIAALAAGSGSAPAPESPAMAVPVQYPTAEQLADAYPRQAVADRIGGRSLMACAIKPDGTMGACRTVGEEPRGRGFGEATLALKRYFRVKPGTFDHMPIPFTELVEMTWTPGGGAAVNVPQAPYLFGREAAVISGLPAPSDAALSAAVACFAAHPATRCNVRRLTWQEAPSGAESLVAVRKSGREQGTDLVLCDFQTDGHLANCQTTSDAASAVMRDVGAKFVAPGVADDGFPTEPGRAVLVLEWERLYPAAQIATSPP